MDLVPSTTIIGCMLDTLTLACVVLCSFGLGRLILSALGLTVRRFESLALSMAAGLGSLGVGLGLLGLFGFLKLAAWLIPIGAVVTLVWTILSSRPWRQLSLKCFSAGNSLALIVVFTAALGAVAPIACEDSLTYPLPIAEQLAKGGVWKFWSFLACSVYPLTQELLEASLLMMGNARVALISAVEFAVIALLSFGLARRISIQPAAGWMSILIGLGCPAAAFLASSAKEDLLLIMMTVAGVLVLSLPQSAGTVILIGLFAGFAAGAKYTGLPVALGLVASVPLLFAPRRFANFGLAAIAAVIAGGIWYAVNIARFDNPIVPALSSVGNFPISKESAREWLVGFGYGRGVFDFVLAPIRMVLDVVLFRVGEFGGRGGWINPLIWVGVAWAFLFRRRCNVYIPILLIGISLYVTWFFGMQVVRLLLPAAVLFSVPAAEALLWIRSRVKLAQYPIGVALALSAGIIITVGALRFGRYISNPNGFIEQSTDHYQAINWMNMNLDPTRDRVASYVRPSAYLQLPKMNLGYDQQVELSYAELNDPALLYSALKRQGFTHVFAEPHRVIDLKLEPWLEPIYTDSESRLAGARFFRSGAVEPVTVFRLK